MTVNIKDPNETTTKDSKQDEESSFNFSLDLPYTSTTCSIKDYNVDCKLKIDRDAVGSFLQRNIDIEPVVGCSPRVSLNTNGMKGDLTLGIGCGVTSKFFDLASAGIDFTIFEFGENDITFPLGKYDLFVSLPGASGHLNGNVIDDMGDVISNVKNELNEFNKYTPAGFIKDLMTLY